MINQDKPRDHNGKKKTMNQLQCYPKNALNKNFLFYKIIILYLIEIKEYFILLIVNFQQFESVTACDSTPHDSERLAKPGPSIT